MRDLSGWKRKGMQPTAGSLYIRHDPIVEGISGHNKNSKTVYVNHTLRNEKSETGKMLERISN